jgi:F-type H+-transporting ATPase subunit epsilon
MAESNTFQCQVFTGEGLMVKTEAQAVVFPAADGLVGILPNHAPLAAALGAGTLQIQAFDQEHFFSISGGVAQMRANLLTIFAERCSRAEPTALRWRAGEPPA